MSEHAHQTALFAWAAHARTEYPELEWLFAVPNGGHRHKAVAGRLKAEGVKSGVPDVALMVPRGGYAGLWIEMKYGRNKPTVEQCRWIEALRGYGHRVEICYDWTDARAVIEEYLSE